MAEFERLIEISASTTVLDVGGTPGIWDYVSVRPRLMMLNLRRSLGGDGVVEIVGDGTKLPFADQSIDVVFSNSVIEHVGDPSNQQLFAAEILRVGRSFCVQTPNRWFPIEPHLLTPLIHYVPMALRRHLIRNLTVWGVLTRPSREYVQEFVNSTHLITAGELRRMFPNADIHRERVAGLTKSLLAVYNADAHLEASVGSCDSGDTRDRAMRSLERLAFRPARKI